MKKDKFTPGKPVYVVERDEDGVADDIAGYIFLAACGHAVILTPYIYGLGTLEEILDYHIGETAGNYDTDLFVFPLSDCYDTRARAELAALKEEIT